MEDSIHSEERRKMVNNFGILLDILTEAFHNTVSENDYQMILETLRQYSQSRCDIATEQYELVTRGWPLTYHPCDHKERIRFAMYFGEKDNTHIQELLLTIDLS
jgi:hypothetical protein